MVEEINITVNRSEDQITYQLPYQNINIFLEGEKIDPQPEIEGNLPFTKIQVGNTRVDFGEWQSTTTNIGNNRIRVTPSYVIRCANDGQTNELHGEGIGNDKIMFKPRTEYIQFEFDEYHYNLAFEGPPSTLTIKTIKDWDSFREVYMTDLTWSTEKTEQYCLGYDKSTDTLYSSDAIQGRTCEYYSSKLRAYIAYFETGGTLSKASNLILIGASEVIPSLKDIN